LGLDIHVRALPAAFEVPLTVSRLPETAEPSTAIELKQFRGFWIPKFDYYGERKISDSGRVADAAGLAAAGHRGPGHWTFSSRTQLNVRNKALFKNEGLRHGQMQSLRGACLAGRVRARRGAD